MRVDTELSTIDPSTCHCARFARAPAKRKAHVLRLTPYAGKSTTYAIGWWQDQWRSTLIEQWSGCQVGRRFMITSATPPRMASEVMIKRGVSASFKNRAPPSAAITGTLSCTVAALVAGRPRTAVYQMA